MQLLDRAAAFQKRSCEPIEQLRMTRRRAHFAEVIRSRYEASAEMVMPDAIHNRAPGESVLRIGDPLRERGAAGAFVLRIRRSEIGGDAGDATERSRRRGFFGFVDIASRQQMD